jgi:hypothetical protein
MQIRTFVKWRAFKPEIIKESSRHGRLIADLPQTEHDVRCRIDEPLAVSSFSGRM